jgi:hypothetical protein
MENSCSGRYETNTICMYVICLCIYKNTVGFIYVLLDHSISLCRVMGQVFRSRERSIIMTSAVKVIRHNCHVAHIYIIIMPSVIKHKIYIFKRNISSTGFFYNGSRNIRQPTRMLFFKYVYL